MSYADNLADFSKQAQVLVVASPRVRVEDWTLHAAIGLSGASWRATFTSGEINEVTINGIRLDEVSAIPVADGQWWLDTENDLLYVSEPSTFTSSITDMDDEIVIAAYELYFSTHGAHWYRDPLDDTTAVKWYEPFILKAPSKKTLLSDALFGSIPSSSTSLTLSNALHTLETQFADQSWNRAKIEVFYAMGELDSTANVKLILKGAVKALSLDQDKISLDILDESDQIEAAFRTTAFETLSGSRSPKTEFYPAVFSFAGNTDPSFIGKPIRRAMGYVEGLVLVNLYHNFVENGTNGPVFYAVTASPGLIGGDTFNVYTVDLGDPNTTTRTYFSGATFNGDALPNATTGLQVGDSIRILVGATPHYRIITNVDRTSHFIEHDALPSTATSTARRYLVSRLDIIQDGVKYTAHPVRDFTISSFEDLTRPPVIFIVINDASIAANVGLGRNLNNDDRLFVRFYDQDAYGIIDGYDSAGSISYFDTGLDFHPTFGVRTNAYTMMHYFLISSGIDPDEIDHQSFKDLKDANPNEMVQSMISETSFEEFPTYKGLIGKLLNTTLTKLYRDTDNKWAIAQLAPFGAATETLAEEDIKLSSYDYRLGYEDVLSQVIVDYRLLEQPEEISTQGPAPKTVSTANNLARFLHNISRQKTFRSLHQDPDDAQVLSDRLSFIFGERRGTISVDSSRDKSQIMFDDIVSVERESLPGEAFSSGTRQTKKAALIEAEITHSGTKLTFDDQRGIEQNADDW